MKSTDLFTQKIDLFGVVIQLETKFDYLAFNLAIFDLKQDLNLLKNLFSLQNRC